MKTMKKIISVLLLVCLLASVLPAAAYADGVPSVTIKTEDGRDTSAAKSGDKFTIVAPFTLPDGRSWSEYKLTWISSNTSVASFAASTTTPDGNNRCVLTCSNSGSTEAQASVYAQLEDTTTGSYTASNTLTVKVAASASATPSPAPTATPVVSIKASAYSVRIGGSIVLQASVANGNFGYWEISAVDSTGMGNIDVMSGNSQVNFTATKAGDVKIIAHAKDSSATAETWIKVTEVRTLKLTCDKERIDNGEKAYVTVANPESSSETFTWSYTTSPSGVDIISKYQDYGTGVDLWGGKGDGSVTVTAKDKYGATASITVQVNSLAYGDAKISPSTATWSKGQGNLTFTVEPTMYAAYIDGVCFTGSGNTSKYSYVWSSKNLVINSSYLATLSVGTHTLRVDTRYDDGTNAGTVYATITINGTANAIYGDNAHVRGNSNNLVFTSTGAIKNVYISNQLIDPANYTLSSDGKTITLKAGFLNLLNYGTYTMKLETQNGSVETTSFRIVTANYAPATGDESNLAIWVAVMMISGVGVVALIPKRKKEM